MREHERFKRGQKVDFLGIIGEVLTYDSNSSTPVVCKFEGRANGLASNYWCFTEDGRMSLHAETVVLKHVRTGESQSVSE